jgi:glycosyltransferase involved in cell wall biosynthesis
LTTSVDNLLIYQPRASYYVGGGEIVSIENAHRLAAMGHQITFVTTKAPFIKESEQFKRLKQNKRVNIKYISLPLSLEWIYQFSPGVDWLRWDIESLHVARLAVSILNKLSSKVVVVHNLMDCLAVPYSKLCITRLHGYPSKFDYHHELVVTIPQTFLSDSQFISKQWQKLSNGKVISRVVENGVDSHKFSHLNLKKKYDVLFVGRLIPIKGVEYLLQAISILKKNSPRVAIVGTGPLQEQLYKLAEHLSITECVKFLGYMPEGKLAELYNSAKIVVLPSYDREGIMTTMLEASSCGVPVITTYAASMPEFITHNQTGILVRPQDPVDLAKAIEDLLKNPAKRAEIGQGARREVTKNWDWDKKIRQLEEEYYWIMKGAQ